MANANLPVQGSVTGTPGGVPSPVVKHDPNEFKDTVFRAGYQLILSTVTNAAIAPGDSVLTPAQVEPPDTRDAGIFDLGPGDGFRLLFVFEPGPTTPVFYVDQIEAVHNEVAPAGDPRVAASYLARICSGPATVALTEGTMQIGAANAAAWGNGAAATWRFAHQIAGLSGNTNGAAIFSPGNNCIAHFEFWPAQGARYARVRASQTATAKRLMVLMRRLRGDAQGK